MLIIYFWNSQNLAWILLFLWIIFCSKKPCYVHITFSMHFCSSNSFFPICYKILLLCILYFISFEFFMENPIYTSIKNLHYHFWQICALMIYFRLLTRKGNCFLSKASLKDLEKPLRYNSMQLKKASLYILWYIIHFVIILLKKYQIIFLIRY